MKKLLLAAAVATLGVGGMPNANAVLIGGPVPDKTFGSNDYNYIGSSISAFTLPGHGTLRLESSSYGDSFGTANVNGNQMQQIFNNNMGVGTTARIDPGYSPFLLYFHTDGTSQSANCNPQGGADCAATLFSNGTTSGAQGGNDAGQANLAIYYAASTGTYAFFFDDGGPSGVTGRTPNDDNDYNDLVVTYRVPEPLSLTLLGSGLVGLGLIRRRNASAKIDG